MSLNLDFKVQKEQKVREIEDSLQNYLPKQKGYRKLLWKLWDIVFWPEERDFVRC